MSEILKGLRLVRMNEDDEVYYAAYGSNLSEDRMKVRCPGATAYGTSVIYGYRLLFKQSLTGAYATVEQDANSRVPVVIYKMTGDDETHLDRFEGYPRYYRKQELLLPIWTLNGVKKRGRKLCIAYIMREHRQLGEPTPEYFSLLDKGYKRWGFGHELIFKALSDSIGEKAAATWLKKYLKENEHG